MPFKNKDDLKSYNLKRRSSDSHKSYMKDYLKKWRANNPEHNKEWRKLHCGTRDGGEILKIASRDYQKNYRTKNAHKIRARRAVFSALRNGTMIRKNCLLCSNTAEAHHEDYSKPLDVIWLCKVHHEKRHHP